MGTAAVENTVLVVEDDPIIRMSAVAALEDAGFRVLDAQDSVEAMEILSQHSEIAVLVTDVRMAGKMDGLALVAQFLIYAPNIRSIVVSGNSSAEAAIKAGALAFVSKPYLAHTIVQAVRDTLLLPLVPGAALNWLPI
jgi:DNA-binding NtrC family response regulator